MPILTAQERLGLHLMGRYQLQTILSEGGMGVLFRALDTAAQRAVAIKMLKPAHELDVDRAARFAREARIAASIHHPNVVRVLDVGTDESGGVFLAMELLAGRSLAEELAERGVLPLAETLTLLAPIAAALAEAHARGIVHRDVKPSNIFLAREESGALVPKLLDFGIAVSPVDDFQTKTGLVVGTPGYMAPEQALRGECGPFTDVWGLAAVLHRCVLGYAPHCGVSGADLLGRLVAESVPAVVIAGASRSLCASVDRALARDPSRRYASMREFLAALSVAAGLGMDPSTLDVVAAVAAQSADQRSVRGAAAPGARALGEASSAPWSPSVWLRTRTLVAVLVAIVAVLLPRDALLPDSQLKAQPSRPQPAAALVSRGDEDNLCAARAAEVLEATSRVASDQALPPTRRVPSSAQASTLQAGARRGTARVRRSAANALSHMGVERERTTGLLIMTTW